MHFTLDTVNLVPALILFGVLQLLLLLYAFSSQKRAPANTYFSLFLFVILLTQVETFFNHSGLTLSYPHVLNTSPPLLFLLGPLLYLHTQKRLDKNTARHTNWLHFVPFVAYLAYSVFFFLQPEAYKYNAYVKSFQPTLTLLEARPIFDTDPLNIQGLVVVELISLHMTTYAVLALWQLKKTSNIISKGWLWFVNIMFCLGGFTLFLSQGGVVNGNRFLESLIPHFSADLFPTLATYALSIYVVKSRGGLKTQGPKYSKSALSQELKAPRAQKVKEVLNAQQPYLQQDFSLKKLAALCQMSPHHLSQILNEQMQTSFFELCNEYRVQEAMRRLTQVSQPPKMEALAYEMGYRSKTTFYKAFKQQTGTTPAQFFQNKP